MRSVNVKEKITVIFSNFYFSIKIKVFGLCIISLIFVNYEALFTKNVDTYMYTYVIGLYNLSVRIIDQVSHTTYVVCDNFVHKWQYLQFKVDSE